VLRTGKADSEDAAENPSASTGPYLFESGRTPYVTESNFSIQRELSQSDMLEVLIRSTDRFSGGKRE
jgi:hypothetical protein